MKFIKKYYILFIFIFLLFSLEYYYSISTSTKNSFGRFDYAALALICIVFNLIKRVKHNAALTILWLWFIWPLFGIGFAASFNVLRNLNELSLDLSIKFAEPLFIHYLFTIFFCIGIILFQKRNNEKNMLGVKLYLDFPNSLFRYILYLFPIVHLFMLYKAWGSIPILSGKNIADDMYQISVGFTQAFGGVLIFSLLMTTYYAITAKNFLIIIWWSIVTLFYMFISMADGKRVIGMIGFFAIYSLVVRIKGVISTTRTIYGGLIALFLYGSFGFIRAKEKGYFSIDTFLNSIGVEFMEFAWTVTHFKPGDIPNYSWIYSTIASMTNGFLLKMLSLNKSALIRLDSSTAWSALHGTDFGIRSGIVSELYFEFGYWGLLVVTLFGIFVIKICERLTKTNSYLNFFFLAYVCGSASLAIMNQSTVTFGSITSGFYIWIAAHLLNLVTLRQMKKMRDISFIKKLN